MVCKCTRSVKALPTSHERLEFLGTGVLHRSSYGHETSYANLHCSIVLQLHLVASESVGPAAVTLLSNGELDALALGQRDPWLLLANDDNVGLTSGELVVNSVLQVDNVEASIVTLTVGDDTNTTHVSTTSDHDDNTGVELDEVGDLASGEVNLDSVVDLDGWVRVADST